MISRYNVWLNDVSLSEINPDIYVANISYQPSAVSIDVVNHARQDGQYSGVMRSIKNNRIAVQFMVRTYDTAGRQSIVQDIIGWAGKGGWLKCSDRLGQKIYVKPSKLPAIASVMGWTDVLTIEFTAYDYPFWLSENENKVVLTSGSDSSLFLAGVWDSFAEVEIVANAAVTSLTVVVGDSSITLNGLNLASGDVLTISYTDEHHIMEIKSNDVSLINKRTVESADDLIVNSGSNNVSFTASGDATCTLKVREVRL